VRVDDRRGCGRGYTLCGLPASSRRGHFRLPRVCVMCARALDVLIFGFRQYQYVHVRSQYRYNTYFNNINTAIKIKHIYFTITITKSALPCTLIGLMCSWTGCVSALDTRKVNVKD